MLQSASALKMSLVNRAWIQWVALGVDVVYERDDAVVDPEALIALTAELGDADARLRDVSTDWCVDYGRYVNGSRLKQVVRELQTPPASIGQYVATVAKAGGPTWPLATQPRSDYVSRGKARLDSATNRARLRVRLRAAFGVNARADILAALLSDPRKGLSVADLARLTRFTKPNVASALDALILAGLVEARYVGNERRVFLTGKGVVLPDLRPPIAQPDWVIRFGVALEVLRFLSLEPMSESIRAIEARGLIESLMDRIVSEGIPQPNLQAFGDAFASAFDRWVAELYYWLRRP
jgi:DNA-binding transcriptional ArsR family regulator